jgi:hypothetical protein
MEEECHIMVLLRVEGKEALENTHALPLLLALDLVRLLLQGQLEMAQAQDRRNEPDKRLRLVRIAFQTIPNQAQRKDQRSPSYQVPATSMLVPAPRNRAAFRVAAAV